MSGQLAHGLIRLLAACSLAGVLGCAQAPAADAPAPDAFDREVLRLMDQADVKGLALAVIDEGRPVRVRAFGLAQLARRQPLRTDTIMYGASLTKTAFAYLVLQLVDEGRLDLDSPIARYLPRPLPAYPRYADLAGDDRWRLLTPRILLGHATGFANFRWLESDRKLRFHWSPGERYGYSGEGLRLLQFVLEQGLGLDVGREMQTRVFDPLGMARTSMTWREDFGANVSEGHDADGKPLLHERRTRADAAGSMDTTIADQALLWQSILLGRSLSPRARAELVRPTLAITSARQFPTLRTESDARGPAIGLSSALGLIVFNDATGPMWFKGGHDDGTGNMVVCQETRRRCVVLLANSVNAERIYPEVVRLFLGETAMPWWWEYHHGAR
jgi:CubicO group peptidase (beta-lactamase class C family)